jgi:uncharacterized protein
MLDRQVTKFWIAIAIGLTALAAGCGDDGPSKKDAPVKAVGGRLKTPVPEALDEGARKPSDLDAGKPVPLVSSPSKLAPPDRRLTQSLDVRPREQRLAAAQDPGEPSAEGPYDEFIRAVVPLIDQYWERKTRRLVGSAAYEPPAHLVSYDGEDSPGCLGERTAEMRGNAYYCASLHPVATCTTVAPNQGYCAGDDVIAWDRSGLMLPFFEQVGDLATALVLAHEWGHLVQARMYPSFLYDTTIRHELQADCLSGAWALEMRRQGRVNIGAFNQTLDLFDTVGGEGEAWLDPSSHGNKFQRIRAFTQGFEADAKGCIGRPFDRMLGRVGLD